MFVSNLENKSILKQYLTENTDDVQLENCSLSQMEFLNGCWHEVSVNNSNANDTTFVNYDASDLNVFRTSMMNICFNNTKLGNASFNGCTLIKSSFLECRINNSNVSQCTMQRMRLDHCIVKESRFSDFEGIYAQIQNTVFYNCHFEVNPQFGMNGFSGAEFRNVIFINCTFKGYPLRGIKAKGAVFAGCNGEITDDADCTDVTGLQGFSNLQNTYVIEDYQKYISIIGELKRSMKSEEQIKSAVYNMDEATLRNCLALLLSGNVSTVRTDSSNTSRNSGMGDFDNFAQAIGYLKNHYHFQELNDFTTEADLVYVKAGDRKVLLTDTTVKPRENRLTGTGRNQGSDYREMLDAGFDSSMDFENAWEPLSSKRDTERLRGADKERTEVPAENIGSVIENKTEDIEPPKENDAEEAFESRNNNGRFSNLEL